MDQEFDALVVDFSTALTAGNTGGDDLHDVAVGLAWTERAFGRGHDLLALSAAAPVASAKSIRDGSADIHALEQPAYSLMPYIVSLAKAEGSTARHGFGKIAVHGAVGGWIAPYIAFHLAQDGFHAAVYWRPHAASVANEAPATLVMAAAAIGGQVMPILIAPGEAYGARQRDKMLVGQVPAQFIAGLHEAADRDPAASVLSVLAAPEGMDAQFTNFISVGDAIHSFGLGSKPPDLVDVSGLGRGRSI